jgi:hypothetical protein
MNAGIPIKPYSVVLTLPVALESEAAFIFMLMMQGLPGAVKVRATFGQNR